MNKGKALMGTIGLGLAGSLGGCYAVAGATGGYLVGKAMEADSRVESAKILANAQTNPIHPLWVDERSLSSFEKSKWASVRGRDCYGTFNVHNRGVEFLGTDDRWTSIPYSAISSIDSSEGFLFGPDRLTLKLKRGSYELFFLPQECNVTDLGNFINKKISTN